MATRAPATEAHCVDVHAATVALALTAAPDDKRPVLSERVEAYGEKRMPNR